MTDALKELLWMVGCTSVMGAVGLIALIGYLRLKRAADPSEREQSEQV